MANKLELTWVGKDEPIRVEPRLLIENAALSNTTTDPGTQNMLIHGDNLLALKALESKYAGQVKCIYIDPPYNTGSAFEHYDDNLEHSQWLNLMRPRLSLLWGLLSDEGSLWISIDDDEQAYMKVLCDELFGRSSFIASIIWQKRTSPDMRAIISDGHDYILVYAKNREMFKENRNKLPLTEEQAKGYKNPDNDPRGPWASSDFTAQGWRPNQMYPITTPSGKIVTPPEGRCWRHLEDVYKQLRQEGRLWFGTDGSGVPRKKTYLSEAGGIVPWTWWPHKEVGNNQEAKKEIIALFGAANAFDTPKPERLIERVLHIASNPGDLVLDSFLGSGTTAAVAHKMGRRYIDQARREGRPILVVAGRPYHMDPEINHGINDLITSYGFVLVTEDAVAYLEDKAPRHVLNQWTYHARMYNAARYVCTQPDMELIQLVSFGCGIDAITGDEMRSILEEGGKLYTQLKIDDISNLGAVKIRIRSLMAAIEARKAN